MVVQIDHRGGRHAERSVLARVGGKTCPTNPTWVEVGAPDAERLHYASKLADRTTIHTHRDSEKVIAAWAGKRIHQLEQITVQSFDPGFVDAAVAVLERRNAMTVTVTDGQLYLDLNGETLGSGIHVHRLG